MKYSHHRSMLFSGTNISIQTDYDIAYLRCSIYFSHFAQVCNCFIAKPKCAKVQVK